MASVLLSNRAIKLSKYEKESCPIQIRLVHSDEAGFPEDFAFDELEAHASADPQAKVAKALTTSSSVKKFVASGKGLFIIDHCAALFFDGAEFVALGARLKARFGGDTLIGTGVPYVPMLISLMRAGV